MAVNTQSFITAKIVNANDSDTIIANMNEVLSKNAHWLQEFCDMYGNDPQKVLDARNDVSMDAAMGRGDLSLVHLMDAIMAWCMYKTTNDQSWLFVVIKHLMKTQECLRLSSESLDDSLDDSVDDSVDEEYMSQEQFDNAMNAVREDFAVLLDEVL